LGRYIYLLTYARLLHLSDVYEEFFNPAMAAQTMLHSAAAKRKEVLQKTMGFIVQVLTSQNLDPRHKSGVMHMVGALAEVLLQVDDITLLWICPTVKWYYEIVLG